jgi:hypothetical protein
MCPARLTARGAGASLFNDKCVRAFAATGIKRPLWLRQPLKIVQTGLLTCRLYREAPDQYRPPLKCPLATLGKLEKSSREPPFGILGEQFGDPESSLPVGLDRAE